MFLKLKFLVTSFTLFYLTYLLTYKCPKVNETSLTEEVLHPLSQHHSTVCNGLSRGVEFVTPYVEKAHGYLDANVHPHIYNHPAYKEYKVEERFNCAKGKYFEHVWPRVLTVFSHFEVVEKQVADYAILYYGHAKSYYYNEIAPKLARKQ